MPATDHYPPAYCHRFPTPPELIAKRFVAMSSVACRDPGPHLPEAAHRSTLSETVHEAGAWLATEGWSR